MFVTQTQIRIHYALTDQMGVVYHGNYAQFYEIGRTESIRELGFTYKDIEKMGIIMPVVDIHSRFLRPAKYDDLITVTTTLRNMPVDHKVVFHSEIHNEESTLLNSGVVTLYFMYADTMKHAVIPEDLRVRVAKHFAV